MVESGSTATRPPSCCWIDPWAERGPALSSAREITHRRAALTIGMLRLTRTSKFAPRRDSTAPTVAVNASTASGPDLLSTGDCRPVAVNDAPLGPDPAINLSRVPACTGRLRPRILVYVVGEYADVVVELELRGEQFEARDVDFASDRGEERSECVDALETAGC